MAYYISSYDSNCSVSQVVKRLSQFRGGELRPDGKKYHVRTRKEIARGEIETIPVYIMKEGKLKKTNSSSIFFNVFGH
tara:strand:+ start:924 stop:1157 length:234 start_codon:yes stop_codon:yes gene_type:complete